MAKEAITDATDIYSPVFGSTLAAFSLLAFGCT
ncbi:hypothetical protein COLO4_01609 [Corchorus olitorius]|uniref:Uncharacterized protein n=1 Tax=Corchorus olitorius TaxID=93759 RepID=A0A1R3L2A4_9ROSI|nr:hypothetical protein COLO4_01609 [Corchorus olitorius]